MPFIDDLALVELLVGFIAVLMAYVGVVSFWAIRTNRPELLRETLRSSALPMGATGGITLGLALWVEATWPFSLTYDGANVLGGYNIFFGDAMVLAGLVAVTYAASAYLGRYLHQAGLLALLAGAAVGFYGWVGYTASPAFTTDPFDTFLMYGAFGVAAIAAFPATIITDYYLHAVAHAKTIWQAPVGSGSSQRGLRASRAVQGVAGSGASSEPSVADQLRYRVPVALQLVMLAFPVLMALAAVAAFWYFGVTLPGHLGHGAANAP